MIALSMRWRSWNSFHLYSITPVRVTMLLRLPPVTAAIAFRDRASCIFDSFSVDHSPVWERRLCDCGVAFVPVLLESPGEPPREGVYNGTGDQLFCASRSNSMLS